MNEIQDFISFLRWYKQYYDKIEDGDKIIFRFRGAFYKENTFDRDLINKYLEKFPMEATWDEINPMTLIVKNPCYIYNYRCRA